MGKKWLIVKGKIWKGPLLNYFMPEWVFLDSYVTTKMILSGHNWETLTRMELTNL